jgi:hypothetical protein
MASNTRKAGARKSKTAAARGGPLPPYGDPIREAIAGGNLRQMKAMAARARKYIDQIEGALARLEGAIQKLGG